LLYFGGNSIRAREAVKTLVLTKQEIEQIIKMDTVINLVEQAFYEHGLGKAKMPAKVYLDLNEKLGDFRAMPAYVLGSCGLKWVSVYPNNRRKGLPTILASLILNDPETGYPLALMEATLITNYRTGAAGAVASKYLAKPGAKSLGLVGSGVQAEKQMEAICQLFDIQKILVWSRSDNSISKFIREHPSYPLKKASIERVCSCDIVCTTTPSRKPLVKLEWLQPGSHINAIGADAVGKRELEPEILKKAKLVVDDEEQAIHSGEINVPFRQGLLEEKDIYATLGKIVANKKPGRAGDEITVFDSTGLAIQDLTVAKFIYETALKQNLGLFIEFTGLPQ
jgi:alanine dehydrogenase